METLLIILTSLFGGLNIFQFIFLRSTKKEYQARAEKASLEANDARFESLQNQIKNMEELYRNQGDVLKQVRKDLIASDQRVTQLELEVTKKNEENKALSEKVSRLEREVKAYKTITQK